MQTQQTNAQRMLSMQEVAKILGVTRVTVYRSLIDKGMLDTFKIGSSRRATPAALARCVERLEASARRKVAPAKILPEVFGYPQG